MNARRVTLPAIKKKLRLPYDLKEVINFPLTLSFFQGWI